MLLYYSYSRLLQEARGSQHFVIYYYHLLSCRRTPSYSIVTMNASTAGDSSAASSRMVGGRRVTAGRGRRGGRCPPPERLPSWRRDPRLERNHGSWAAMAAAAAPPAMLHAAAAASAPPVLPLARRRLPEASTSLDRVLQSREHGTQVLWGCSECLCWRLTQRPLCTR